MQEQDIFHRTEISFFYQIDHTRKAMAMALLNSEFSGPGIKVEADVRGKMLEAETCALPFYKKI